MPLTSSIGQTDLEEYLFKAVERSDMSNKLTILTATHVDSIVTKIDPDDVILSQTQVFQAFSSVGQAKGLDVSPLQMPQRHVLTSPHGTMLFMPSRVANMTACKIVSVMRSTGEGLPASTVIMDEASGKARAIVNARQLTALRNAAGSALSLRALGSTRHPQRLVIFGSGSQAGSHAILFLKLYTTITTCTIVVRRVNTRSSDLVDSLSATFPHVSIEQGVASYSESSSEDGFSLSDTVRAADIILTMTPSTEALFASADVTPGTHLCLIGSYKPSMHEVEDDLIRRAGVIVVDSREACALEAGELISTGVQPEAMVELGELLGNDDLRQKVLASGDINIFKSVGLGVQDVAIASLVLGEAERLGLGTVIEDYD